ncbi:MAG: glycerophosphodiester phosphodiesterase, partial [Candidatus Thorarchaeota archaeon]
CIENTLPCFRKAVETGVGIETDIQLTKDNVLVCFHDHFIQIKSEWINVKNLTFKQLTSIKFEDNRKIPTVNELFTAFIEKKHNLRYSFDIRGEKEGQALIDLALEFQILDKIEITERNLKLINVLRRYNKFISLVYTLNESISKITTKTVNFSDLRKLGVKAINLKCRRANFENFKVIIDNNLECYAWDINNEKRMIKVLTLENRNHRIAAIYTDYPRLLLNCINKMLIT